MKTYALLLLLALLILGSVIPVSALSLELSSEKENYVVSQGEKEIIEFNLFSFHDDRIIMSVKDVKAWMSLAEIQPKVDANQNKTMQLLLEPNFKTTPGVYKINIIGTSQLTGDKSELELYISLLSSTDSVIIERIIVDGEFKPFTDIMFTTSIKNGKSVTLHGLKVNLTLLRNNIYIDSTVGIIDTVTYNSTTDINFTMKLGKNIPSGVYTIRAKLYDGNILLDETDSPDFSIKSVPLFDRKDGINIGFIGVGPRIVIENVGNVKGSTSVEEDLGFLSFLYTGDAPQTKEGDVYKWTFELDPGQTVTVSYYINYLPIILVILIILGIIWYVLTFMFTVKLRKYIMNQKKLEDGAQFTIGIEITNETMNDINDVVVRDFVPHIFNLENQTTIKPVKKKTPLGTELIWRLDKLRKGDARVISYTVKSKIGVSGSVRLGSSNVRYKYKGMRFLKDSNEVALGTGGETS